ncbi:MAG: DinB family protein [Actinobacteria bacterium]|nr:DinB family protein [Actinomycetota bacterium]
MNEPRPDLRPRELDGYEPEIGAAVWRLQDSRRRTLRSLKEVPAKFINRVAGINSIGTVLYHIALIEADWLYTEILEQEVPPGVRELLPQEDRDEKGRLTEFGSESLESHLSRLAAIRERLLDAMRTMSSDDFHRPRSLQDYDVSPSWVLHHLAQHEAEHRGEIESVIAQFKAAAEDEG